MVWSRFIINNKYISVNVTIPSVYGRVTFVTEGMVTFPLIYCGDHDINLVSLDKTFVLTKETKLMSLLVLSLFLLNKQLYVVQDPPDRPWIPCFYHLLLVFIRLMYTFRSFLRRGESRPVLSPTHRTLSRQIMKTWEPWTTIINNTLNTRMIDQD